MSLQLVDDVLTKSNARGTARHVLMVLAHHVGEKGQAWPSQATIARECGISDRSVRTALKALQEMGEIEQEAVRNRCVVWSIHPGRTRKDIPTTESVTPEASSDFAAPHKPVRKRSEPGRICTRTRKDIPTNPQEPSVKRFFDAEPAISPPIKTLQQRSPDRADPIYPQEDVSRLLDSLRSKRPTNSGRVRRIDYGTQHLGDRVSEIRDKIYAGGVR